MRRSTFVTTALAALCTPAAAPAQSFSTLLDRAIASIPGSVGVLARTMAPGPPLIAYNADLSFPSASTIKLVIMLTAFLAAENDPSVMQEPIVFRRRRLMSGSDFLAQANDGQRFTVHQLIVPMIQLSDNTAANLLIDHFGFDRVNAAAQKAGMHRTVLRRHFMDFTAILAHMDNRTSPADMARLLYLLEEGAREAVTTVAGADSCNAMIRIMLGQTDRDTIPRGIPGSVPVANKTGELSRSRSDVAIVNPYGNSPYVLAIYASDLQTPESAYAGIADISRLVFARIGQSGI